jgi:hypothetical protein
MQVKVKVHSHDTGLPEHDQVQFHTEHPGGLLVLRLPKGSALPPLDSEYTASFTSPDQDAERTEDLQKQLDEAYQQGKAYARKEASQPQEALQVDAGGPAGSDQGGA